MLTNTVTKNEMFEKLFACEMKETIQFIVDPECLKSRDKLYSQGYRYKCVKCNVIYKKIPREEFNDFSNINECYYCGCDLFESLDKVDCKKIQISPVDGVIVLKQHNFKYCKCHKGELWTGDVTTECCPNHEDSEVFTIGEFSGKVVVCDISGLVLISLDSTQEELKNAGFLRYL